MAIQSDLTGYEAFNLTAENHLLPQQDNLTLIRRYFPQIKKVYNKAKTPYQRILECNQIDETAKQKLRAEYGSLNPAELRRNIIAKIDKLNKLKINKI